MRTRPEDSSICIATRTSNVRCSRRVLSGPIGRRLPSGIAAAEISSVDGNELAAELGR